jgi:hypothetical protein
MLHVAKKTTTNQKPFLVALAYNKSAKEEFAEGS